MTAFKTGEDVADEHSIRNWTRMLLAVCDGIQNYVTVFKTDEDVADGL